MGEDQQLLAAQKALFEQVRTLYGKFLHLAVDAQLLGNDATPADLIRLVESGVTLLDEAKAAGLEAIRILRDIGGKVAAN